MPASTALNFTGERFAPEVTGAIWYEHWHRYCVAQPLARGLSVLDAACGEGYGSYLLAQTAKEFGIVLLGVFASTAWNPTANGGVNGLLAGDPSFFLKQLAAGLFSSVWALIFTLGMLWIIDRITPVRVEDAHEELGLDEAIHGETAYVEVL